MAFEPIAIVGRACVLPGALSPEALWQALVAGRDLTNQVPEGRWKVGLRAVEGGWVPDPSGGRLADSERTLCDRGGYVGGFEQLWQPQGFALPAEQLAGLDPLEHWLLHCGREALAQARGPRGRCGAVIGQLGFPSEAMAGYADAIWYGGEAADRRHRFMSGGAAERLAQALRLDGGSLCLDAACASAIYALKLACDRLHDGSADLMLAGAVQRADDLFLHMGFSALAALSPSGQSRPFHADADGLLPAEGCALFALKRVADARRDGDRIHGLIRGIGLGNDGRGRGLLVPDAAGQERAMRAAYASAAIDPRQIGLLECHATGTQVGDATELTSSAAVFAGHPSLPIGSLKSNLGHLITAAGAAGLIKLLEAFKRRQRPPQRPVQPPHPALRNTPFRLLTSVEEWPSSGPRLAALSAFGFGGNNAHLVLSEDDPGCPAATPSARSRSPLAVVGVGAVLAEGGGRVALAQADAGSRMPALELDLAALRQPPRDLEQTLPQQLAIAQACRQALAEAESVGTACAVLIGIEPDAEVARFGSRWRRGAEAAPVAALESAGVIGCMPNIPANRLNSVFDLQAAGFTVQAGADSGLAALRQACRLLWQGEAEAALIGAVDLACEPVNQAASGVPCSDAALAWLIKPLAAAEAAGERIHALIDDESVAADGLRLDDFAGAAAAGAAEGLHRASRALLALQRGFDAHGRLCRGVRQAAVGIDGGGDIDLRLRPGPPSGQRHDLPLPRLTRFAAGDRAALLSALAADRPGGEGPVRLALVATAEEYAALRQRTLLALREGLPLPVGAAFRESPLPGELAFMFAGAGASYHGMGGELLATWPWLLDRLAERSQRLAAAFDWVFAPGQPRPGVAERLAAASALSQLHVSVSEDLLGLRADAWLGYSSGETNALVAAGVWNDADGLLADMDASGLLERELGGEFRAIAGQWGRPVEWSSWQVLAPIDQVAELIAELPRLHIAIINSDDDCLLCGETASCEEAVRRIGSGRCLALDYPLAVHVPELAACREAWLALHRRPTSPLRHGRLYSTARGRAYAPDAESCAQAILEQADRRLDLRPVIRQAYADGVRVFLEHGPRGQLARAVRSILGDREALVVSLDRPGQGLSGLLQAAAALWTAGVAVDLQRLDQHLRPARELPAAVRPLRLPAHWPAVTRGEGGTAAQRLPVAPRLPSMRAALAQQLPVAAVNAGWMASSSMPPRSRPAAAVAHTVTPPQAVVERVDRQHQQYLQQQAALHQQFLQLQRQAQQMLVRVGLAASGRPRRPPAAAALPMPLPSLPPLPVATVDAMAQNDAAPSAAPALALERPRPAAGRAPCGPSFDRAQLEVHADGRIADIFGAGFAGQAGFARQVRMPKPPLLLADRVTGLDGEPGSMGKGTIWTETEVGSQDWYLHHDRMPAGVMIEAGQADLMLISWLGVDALNRGQRVYRLLGCELTYHGELPKRGETLSFQIDLDGHAAQGDVRLMFFHYDCWNGARRQLSVRKGQAGFFTDAELAESAGCLWGPEQQAIVAEPRLDPPVVRSPPTALSRAQLQAFADGDAAGCFGAGFEFARTHSRSPSIHGGRMLLLDRVTELTLEGGPWQRGYLRAELDVQPQQWFFDGHFKNDPCMPGTLMFEACLQAMALYLAACGYTLERDGWRFEPLPELPYQLQCRGQVTSSSRLLVTEVFVEERLAGPQPTVYADLLCTVDGLKAFHARRVALQMVPDWPLAETEIDHDHSGRAVAEVDGFRFDRRALLATATGRPSAAFGPIYRRFDGPGRVPRLPSPPYHFISRIAEVHGPIGVMRAGARVVAEYDVPNEAWYFERNGAATMPFAVLLEAALQPCGWLASYVGSALTVDAELGFRNLDGDGEVLAELSPGCGVLITEVELTDVSASAGMIIQNFRVRCRIGEQDVYRLNTVFGFFPPAALAAQAGLPISASQRELLERAGNRDDELNTEPVAWFNPVRPRLPASMLRMLDRLEGYWPQAGAAGLGQLRAVKQVDPGEWFFKAHFFQDPVQPGSLGLEALLQLLQLYLLEAGMDAGIQAARFETIALGRQHRWKYRGQVLPQHRAIHSTLEITQRGHDQHGAYAIADGALWVDGQRIYEAQGLAVRVVSGRAD